MLYIVVCAAGATRLVPSRFLPMATERGWDVHVLTTAQAIGTFPEVIEQIESVTGRPVRADFHTTVGYSLPDPDAVVVAPASYNTVTKLALGIADTYVLTRLTEQIGRGIPIVIGPYINEKFAKHPTYEPTLERLRSWGLKIVIGPDEPHQSGGGAAETFPWAELLDAIEPTAN
ncbi:flavoprotein [Myceligenerans crystallogenes]|uniref:Flavoprotein n=1 Tax=Myceligenerans crystallogenes TaxID=316335 RepID=A0ABP5A1P3_9MICO